MLREEERQSVPVAKVQKKSLKEELLSGGMSVQELWAKCLSLLKLMPAVTDDVFNHWLKDIEPLEFTEEALYLKVPSVDYVDYIRTQLPDQFTELLNFYFAGEVEIIFEYTQKVKEIERSEQELAEEYSRKEKYAIPLNDTLNFDNFYESPCNKLVRDIAETVAISPKQESSSLLFIYGASGVGKTHLSQAVAQLINKQHPDLKVAYIPFGRFETQYIYDARCNSKTNFISYYQDMDVLIIDDIQGLIGKEKTQQAFFEIFNHLRQLNKQMFFTSDVAPANFYGLEDRILTRLQSAMVLELKRPDFELRCKYLREKSKEMGISISEDIVKFIAQNLRRNIRELSGLLNTLMAKVFFVPNREVSLAMAQESITLITGTQIIEKPNMERIKQIICKAYNLEEEVLLNKGRKKEIALPRQVLMYLAKKLTDLSFPAIGEMLKRNHTTVMHGCKAVEEMLEKDQEFKLFVEQLEQKISEPEEAKN